MLTTSTYSIFRSVGVPELLSGMTRNHVGFARAGSNPAAHDLFISHKNLFYIKNKRVVIGLEISNPTAHNFELLYFLFSGRAGVVNGHD